MTQHVRIESSDQWDTLALVRQLPRCRWFLVERRNMRWDVHVDVGSSEVLADVLDVVEQWARERQLDSVAHLRDRDFPLRTG